MASFLAVGSISALEYGNRLFQLPLGIFAISAGTVLLPTYSRLVAQKDFKSLSDNLRFTSVSLVYLMLPITTLIIALGSDFVKIVFERGAFDAKASLWTTQALVFYSLGLVFFSLNQTLTPLFFANKDTKTPVRVAASMMGLNIVLNFFLMQFLQHRGLALATSLTACVNYIVLIVLIRKRMPQVNFSGIFNNIWKTFIICVALLGVLYLANSIVTPQSLGLLIVKDVSFVALFILTFYAIGLLLRLDYLSSISKSIWKKFQI